VEARKVKVDLHLRVASETPEREVRDLVDWPTATSQPAVGGVVLAGQDEINVDRALQVAHRGTAHLPLETLSSDCWARGKAAGTVDNT